MGQSAGAVNVYALLTSPPIVDAQPALFHRAVPISGGISLASNLPPGSIPTLAPASAYRGAGQPAAATSMVIADGLAADAAGAAGLVASQTAAADRRLPALQERRRRCCTRC